MTEPHFLLIGIGGVYNYGCEAIVRGTELLIRQRWPGARLTYASCRPDDDRSRLAGCAVETVRRPEVTRYSLRNLERKLLSCIGLGWKPLPRIRPLLKSVDAVLSIGGDIYTLRPDGSYAENWIRFGNFAEKLRIPYVLWGASVGPFDRDPVARTLFQQHLQRISLISARECHTRDYLAALGVARNVVTCADPAFAVAQHLFKPATVSSARPVIGVNFSPLSLRHSAECPDDMIHRQIQVVEGLVRAYNARVLLIPHVVCEFAERDDDLRHLRRILDRVSSKFRCEVELLDQDLGFIGTKKRILACDMVIAARMHCAINAISAHVPTLLLAYSQKALGMGEYVYGGDNWVLRIEDLDTPVFWELVERLMADKGTLQLFLEDRMKAIQLDAIRPIAFLGELLGC